MQILTITEHSYINVENKRDLEKNTISYEDKQLLYDIEFKNKNGEKEYIFDIRKNVKTKNFVGSIQLKNGLIIEILPKFAKDNLTKDNIEKFRKTLLNMLFYSNKVKFLYSNDLSNHKIQTMPLIEAFIYLFAKNLLNEFRQGLYFDYKNRDENLNFLKGKFLAHKNLRENLIDKSKIYVEFFEYSENNLLMQIFKSVTLILLYNTNISYNTKSILTEILAILDEVKIINFDLSLFEKINFNRTNERFEKLFIQLKSIMQNLMPFTSSINPSNFWTILFDMNELFEKFISYLFYKNSINFIEQKSCDIYKSEAKKVIARPDFILMENQNIIGVVDAKWKLLQDEKNLMGLYASDFWQLSSYMNYIENHQINGYFIVPKNDNNLASEIEFEAIDKRHKNITILAIDFSQDWEDLTNTIFNFRNSNKYLDDEILLIKKFKLINDKELINLYFDLLQEIIVFAKLENSDEKFVTSIPQSGEYIFPITINQRYILAIKKMNKTLLITLIIDYLAFERFKNYSYSNWQFSGEVNAPYLIYFTKENFLKIQEDIKPFWKQAILKELETGNKSGFKKYHKDIVSRVALDLDYRNILLNKI